MGCSGTVLIHRLCLSVMLSCVRPSVGRGALVSLSVCVCVCVSVCLCARTRVCVCVCVCVCV